MRWLKFSSILYCLTDLKIPESEAFEILKVASHDCRLDQPDKSNGIFTGNYLFDPYMRVLK